MSANYIDSTGLHTQSYNDLVTQLQDGMKGIYGPTINLQPNSPDAQLLNLFALVQTDQINCITQVNAGFDPNQAVGVVLDQRCAINGIVRKGATYTLTNVSVTCTATVTLAGLDSLAAPFTVQDLTGNQFVLVTSAAFPVGTTVAVFRALKPGQIETIPNTITTITTVTLGVSGVNNPDSALYTGTTQESDVALRIRRAQSVSLPSQGYLAGLQGALLDLEGVVDAEVYENDTNVTDANGIPPHSIWCVVEGGDNTAIAEVIYNKRNAGCGMKGSINVTVPQVNGFDFVVSFSPPTFENLWVELAVESLDPDITVDTVAIQNLIYDSISYKIYEPADYTAITTIVKNEYPWAVVVTGGVSNDGITFEPFLYPSTLAGIFVLSLPRINIIGL